MYLLSISWAYNYIPLLRYTIDMSTRLTRKQQAFVKGLIDNPKKSATEVASQVYDVKNRSTARSIASENLAKPSIIMALGEHTELFESAIVQVVRDWKDSENTRKREIAVDTARWGHDKIYGRATQSVQVQSNIVRVSIDLTGGNEEPPAELLDE